MSATIKYAYLHRQTWLYRRNYPKHLQPLLGQALKQSLKTGDARVARARVTEANAVYERIVNETGKQQPSARDNAADKNSTLCISPPRFGRIRLAGRVKVSELAKRYLNQRSEELSAGAFKSVRFSIGLFVSAFGTRQLSDLGLDDGKVFLRQVSKLSPNVAKSASTKGFGLSQLVSLSGEANAVIAPQTQKRICKQVRQFMDWAAREDHLGAHCFSRMRVNAKSEVRSYAVPTDAEVTTMVRRNDTDLGPILLLCLLSGLRSGEACGLFAEDFVTKGNLGVFVRVRPNRLRALKSQSAERDVPLHDLWLPHLQSLPSQGALFPSLDVNKITKRFAIFRRDNQLDRPGLVFHSTRKWFITQCERTGVPEHFAATLVGHQSARSDNKLTYGLYSAGISDAQKREIVDQVQLPTRCQT